MVQPGKQQPEPPQRVGVSLTQVIAGALASVSAAVVASYFSIAGTLIGAATTSVVIIVGGALYQRTIERTHGPLVRIWRNPRTGGVTRADVTAAPAPTGRGRIRWDAVLGGLAAVLGLTFGTVTAVELLAQQPLAALVQQEPPPAGQTTLGVAVREVMHELTDAPPTPTTDPTRPAVGTARPTTEATSSPSATGTPARTPTPARRTTVPTTGTPTAVATPPAPAAVPTTVVPTAAATPPAPAATPQPSTPAPP